jgi:hypothetical protein
VANLSGMAGEEASRAIDYCASYNVGLGFSCQKDAEYLHWNFKRFFSNIYSESMDSFFYKTGTACFHILFK